MEKGDGNSLADTPYRTVTLAVTECAGLYGSVGGQNRQIEVYGSVPKCMRAAPVEWGSGGREFEPSAVRRELGGSRSARSQSRRPD